MDQNASRALIQAGQAVLGIEFGSTRIKAVLVDGAPVRTRGKKVYIALNRPWQSGPLKHVLHGEMVPQWPGSLLRRLPDVRFCMTEDIARGIV